MSLRGILLLSGVLVIPIVASFYCQHCNEMKTRIPNSICGPVPTHRTLESCRRHRFPQKCNCALHRKKEDFGSNIHSGLPYDKVNVEQFIEKDGGFSRRDSQLLSNIMKIIDHYSDNDILEACCVLLQE